MEESADGVVEQNTATMDTTMDTIGQFHDKFSRHVTEITVEDETEVVNPPSPLPILAASQIPTSISAGWALWVPEKIELKLGCRMCWTNLSMQP